MLKLSDVEFKELDGRDERECHQQGIPQGHLFSDDDGEPVEFLRSVVPCVRHHHEWYDGCSAGYPDRLSGDQIPLASRIIVVADTVEAMTSDRPYRKALPVDVVVKEMHKYSGTQFDPVVVNAFLKLLEVEGESFISKDQKFDIYAFIKG